MTRSDRQLGRTSPALRDAGFGMIQVVALALFLGIMGTMGLATLLSIAPGLSGSLSSRAAEEVLFLDDQIQQYATEQGGDEPKDPPAAGNEPQHTPARDDSDVVDHPPSERTGQSDSAQEHSPHDVRTRRKEARR